MSTIFWEDQPPIYPSARIWIPPTGKSSFALLGPPKGKWVHWLGPRSLPCLREHCPRSRHRRPANWYGYYPVALPVKDKEDPRKIASWSIAVVSCSSENARVLAAVGQDRHVYVNIVRSPDSKQFEILSTQRMPETVPLPPSFSVELVLYRVWGLQVQTDDRIPKGQYADQGDTPGEREGDGDSDTGPEWGR